jgi:hypothetical protein
MRYVSSAGLSTLVRKKKKKKLIRVLVTIDIKDAFNSWRKIIREAKKLRQSECGGFKHRDIFVSL